MGAIAVVVVMVAGAALLRLRLDRMPEVGGTPAAETGLMVPELPQSAPLLEWAPTGLQAARYWAVAARGTNPAMTPIDANRGTVGPMTSTLRPGGVAPTVRLPLAVVSAAPWLGGLAGNRAPGAAAPALPGGPPGASVPPLPVAPAQPTPQSAVSSDSPYLPRDLMLEPLALNRWMQPASMLSVWSIANQGGVLATRIMPAVPAERA